MVIWLIFAMLEDLEESFLLFCLCTLRDIFVVETNLYDDD